MRALPTFVAVAAGLAAVACDSSPPQEVATFELAFEVRSSGVDNDGTVIDEVAIASLADDPWGSFVTAARDTLGVDPTQLEVRDVRLRLDPLSQGVADLGEVFHGPVSVDLRVEASGVRYDLAEGLINEEGVGTEVPLAARLRFADLPAEERDAVLAGGFTALFIGQAGIPFRQGNATAALVVEATFVATE